MLKRYFCTSLKSKTTVAVFIALICYAIIPVFDVNLLSSTAWEATPSFFNANYANFFFIYGITFIVVPLFFVFLQPNRTFFEKDCIIVRFGSYRKYWRIRVLVISMESAAYVVFLYLLILLRAVYFGQTVKLLANILFLLKAAVSQTMTFFLLAVIFSILSDITNNAVIAFACSYALVANDYAVRQTGIGVELFALRAITIRPDHMESYISTLFLVISLTLLCYIIFSFVLEARDRLPREEK